MTANAGIIRARMELNNQEFKQKMQETREDMKRTGFSAEQMSADFGKIQKASLIVGTAVVGAIGGSVKIAADFETGMSKVQAISGSTAEEFKLQEEAARRMGAETQYSAVQASDALSYLALAGFDVTEQIESLPSVLNAAAAGNIDLASSADIVSNIMTGFGLSADETGEAVDVLVKSFTTANTDLPQLGEAMKYVAPIASSLGWDITDAATAISKMSDAGIQGGQAGTALRASLLALSNPTGQTAKVMEELNIEVLDAEGNMKSLPDLIGHVSEKMEGMTDAQKTQAVAQLVGSQATSGFISLLEVGEDGLKDYTKELENAGGTAQEIADIQNDNLAGSFKEFQSAMEEAGIKIGQEFLPVFREIVEWGTKIVSSFDEINVEQAKSALAFAGTAAAIGLTISTIGKLVIAVRGLMASMGPVGWLTLGLSVLGGVIAVGAVETESLSDQVERLGQEFDDLESLDEKIDEFDRLQGASKLTNDQFAEFVDITDEINRTTDPEKLDELKEAQKKLAKESGLSVDELVKMVDLNDDLVEKVPGATDKITDQGNAIIETTDALKDYSKEKLDSLHTELDLARLSTELKYKKALEDEVELIKKKKEDFEKIEGLQIEQNKKQDDLNALQDELNDMKEDGAGYSHGEIRYQERQIDKAEKLLEAAEKNVVKQSEKVQGHDKELEKIREEIDGYEEIRDKMIAVLLKQEGLTAEKGKGLEVVEEEIKALEKEKETLEEVTDEALKNTDGYKEAKRAIDKKIESLVGVHGKIGEITGDAEDLNDVLGEEKEKRIKFIGDGLEKAKQITGELSKPAEKRVTIWEQVRSFYTGSELTHEGGVISTFTTNEDDGELTEILHSTENDTTERGEAA